MFSDRFPENQFRILWHYYNILVLKRNKWYTNIPARSHGNLYIDCQFVWNRMILAKSYVFYELHNLYEFVRMTYT